VLRLNPRLPKELKDLNLRICYRGHCIKLDMTHEQLEIASMPSVVKPIKIQVRDEMHMLAPGEVKVVPL
jgi:trehalose/maltose hydrolase-like predicted phosphorylase